MQSLEDCHSESGGMESALELALPEAMSELTENLDWTMVTSFFSEMDALDAAVQAPAREVTTCDAGQGDKSAAVSASNLVPTKATNAKKKRKISSTERKKREKTELLRCIYQLQSQLEQISTRIQKKRQKLETRHELNEENFRLRWIMRAERERANRLNRLLRRLRTAIKPIRADFANCAGVLHSSGQETRIVKLERRISDRFRHVVQRWMQNTLPVVVGEGLDTVQSPDGLHMEHRLVRVLPFDVKTIADAFWRSGQLDMRKFYYVNQDTLAMAEEIVVCPPGHAQVSLLLHVVFKRFTHRNQSMFMWEGDCTWSDPFGKNRSVAVESGWSLVDSLGTGANLPVSSVQIFSPVALVEPGDRWLELLEETRKISRPGLASHHKILTERFQRVENRLVDEAVHSC